ncbi:MAG: Rrf2 family transcriptional regulator [Candidatus Omnitrophica bacterium]|nr:Rrf2 family transcriptional regulator [Candidatus Omnitrophota bacterium]
MKLTFKGDYALKAVLDLATRYGQGVVTIHEMAERIDAPVKFLEQILFDLKRGGFIESRRGNAGGYLLGKPPRDITVGDIVRFVDGPIEPIACVNCTYTECRDLANCVFKNLWQRVFQATSEIVDTVNFEDLASQASLAQNTFSYAI